MKKLLLLPIICLLLSCNEYEDFMSGIPSPKMGMIKIKSTTTSPNVYEFYLDGQSNMCHYTTQNFIHWKILTNSRLYVYNYHGDSISHSIDPNFFVTHGTGPAFFIARYLLAADPTCIIKIYQYAIPSTNLAVNWLPSNDQSYFHESIIHYERFQELLTLAGVPATTKRILGRAQGEADAAKSLYALPYYTNETFYLDTLKHHFNYDIAFATQICADLPLATYPLRDTIRNNKTRRSINDATFILFTYSTTPDFNSDKIHLGMPVDSTKAIIGVAHFAQDIITYLQNHP